MFTHFTAYSRLCIAVYCESPIPRQMISSTFTLPLISHFQPSDSMIFFRFWPRLHQRHERIESNRICHLCLDLLLPRVRPTKDLEPAPGFPPPKKRALGNWGSFNLNRLRAHGPVTMPHFLSQRNRQHVFG